MKRSNLDGEVRLRIATARKELEQAFHTCKTFKGNPKEISRARRVARELQRLLSALDKLPRATPLYDTSDPDLLPYKKRENKKRDN